MKPFTLFAISASIFFLNSALQPKIATAAIQEQKHIEESKNVQINNYNALISGRMSLGYLTGESGELVYLPNGHKASELKWDIERAHMLGLGASVSPWQWCQINADVWFSIGGDDSKMDDYDWFIEDFQFTHWSHHEDVDLTKGLKFDINGEVMFYQHDRSKFFGIIGFKYDNWKWTSFGGDYVYSRVTLYDAVGSFEDGEKGITYEQNFYAPYLGLGFSTALAQAPINFNGRFIFAPYVWGDDEDQHHLRDLVFEDNYDSGTMLSFDVSSSYYFTKNWSVSLAFHYEKYYEMKGDTLMTDITTGEQTYYGGDAAGMEHQSSMISFGLSYKL